MSAPFYDVETLLDQLRDLQVEKQAVQKAHAEGEAELKRLDADNEALRRQITNLSASVAYEEVRSDAAVAAAGMRQGHGRRRRRNDRSGASVAGDASVGSTAGGATGGGGAIGYDFARKELEQAIAAREREVSTWTRKLAKVKQKALEMEQAVGDIPSRFLVSAEELESSVQSVLQAQEECDHASDLQRESVLNELDDLRREERRVRGRLDEVSRNLKERRNELKKWQTIAESESATETKVRSERDKRLADLYDAAGERALERFTFNDARKSMPAKSDRLHVDNIPAALNMFLQPDAYATVERVDNALKELGLAGIGSVDLPTYCLVADLVREEHQNN